MKTIFLILLLRVCGTLNAQVPITDSLDLFLLLGQSNMAGYGVILPQDRQSIENVYTLRESDQSFHWEKASQPIHKRLSSDAFCLAGPFAKRYVEMFPDKQVGLIPMAWGGAELAQMSKGTEFYQQIITASIWAKKNGSLKGILFHQGESDTTDPEKSQSYLSRLQQFITDLRADLSEPELVVIVGNLAEFYSTGKDHNSPERVKQIDQVKQSLKEVANTTPNTLYVESTGLRSIDHHQVHFDRESYIIFGNRYFDAYWQHLYR